MCTILAFALGSFLGGSFGIVMAAVFMEDRKKEEEGMTADITETDGVITIEKQSAKDVGEIKNVVIHSPNYTRYFYNESMPTSAEATDVYKAHEEEHLNIVNRIKELQYEIAKTQTIVGKMVASAEAVQGEWEHWGSPFSDESEVIDTIVCSVCGARFIEPKDEPKGEYNYCPNCGAKMHKGGDSE